MSNTKTLPSGGSNWAEELAFEVALEYFTPEDLQLKYDLPPDQYEHVTALPSFRKAVSEYRREIDDEGIAFRLRARRCADDILVEVYAMAFDEKLDAKDRLKAAEMICRYAGFETAKTDGEGGVKLQIYTNLNLSSSTPDQTYTIEIPNDNQLAEQA
jgi:hypothetical protein